MHAGFFASAFIGGSLGKSVKSLLWGSFGAKTAQRDWATTQKSGLLDFPRELVIAKGGEFYVDSRDNDH
jgi:hypothetical protein